MKLVDRWRRRADDARRIKGDPPPTYAQLEATVATLTVLTKQQGGIIRNLRSQVDSLMVENAQLRAAELGVVAAESKPGGGKLDREMPRLELDPDPTRLYVLPGYGVQTFDRPPTDEVESTPKLRQSEEER